MRIRGMRAVAGLAAAALVVTGCGSDSGGGDNGGGGGGGDENDFRIGVSFYSNVIPLYVEMEKGMRDKAEELGVELSSRTRTTAPRTRATRSTPSSPPA